MSERERAIGLYTFLKEFAQLRTRPVRDIATYEREGEVIWAADIPREPAARPSRGAAKPPETMTTTRPTPKTAPVPPPTGWRYADRA